MDALDLPLAVDPAQTGDLALVVEQADDRPVDVPVVVLRRGGEDDAAVAQRRGVAEAEVDAVELAEVVAPDRAELRDVDAEVARHRLDGLAELDSGDRVVGPLVVAAVEEEQLLAEHGGALDVER